MLIARGNVAIHDATLSWAFALSLRVWCLVVNRKGLVLDTRFVPASGAKATSKVCIYLLLSGTFRPHGAAPIEGPAAFLLSAEDLEGAGGRRTSTFRSHGDPYVAIEVRLDRADLATATPSGQPFALDEATWAAAKSVADLPAHDDQSLEARTIALIERLARSGIVTEATYNAASKLDAWPIARLWRAVRPMVAALAPSSSLDEVSRGAGVSTRQAARDLGKLLPLSLMGTQWRTLTLHSRVKVAVLLLSADRVSVREVAAIVGYSGVNALARAFRDAGIDAPSVVQSRLREG